MNNIETSFALLKSFFDKENIKFWLEAGTALSAEREGKVFTWEHDIDVAIWRDELPSPKQFVQHFASAGYKVIFQKNYPFVDNLIQLRVVKDYEEKLFDVDIYLYTRFQGYADMRWIHKPDGSLAALKLRTLSVLKYLVNPTSDKWKRVSRFLPNSLSKAIFLRFLRFHVNHSTCIYHRFPERYFLEFKEIEFHGIRVLIPLDIDNYLQHRYGPNWKTPDSQFNQTGKWKQSEARVELDMRLLPLPIFDERLLVDNV